MSGSNISSRKQTPYVSDIRRHAFSIPVTHALPSVGHKILWRITDHPVAVSSQTRRGVSSASLCIISLVPLAFWTLLKPSERHARSNIVPLITFGPSGTYKTRGRNTLRPLNSWQLLPTCHNLPHSLSSSYRMALTSNTTGNPSEGSRWNLFSFSILLA